MWRFWSGKGKIAIQAFLVQKVWLEMKGLTLLTLSEMSDPTFLTLGSVSPFTFVSPWLSDGGLSGSICVIISPLQE